MKRTPFILLAVWAPLWCAAQTYEKAAPPLPPAPLNNLQGAWDRSANEAEAGRWREANGTLPGNAAVQWNWFRSEYDALNSRNNGSLGAADRKRLDGIADLLAASAPNSFEHQLADYYLTFPAPEAFSHIEAAHGMAPDRAELIAPMLSKAMRDGDAAAMREWSAALERRGGLAPALGAVAHDVFLSVPDDAILFANGDMDAQPLVAMQMQQQESPGVLVVDRRLLADAGYRSRIWAGAGGSGAVPADGPAFAQALLKACKRPVYFTLSLDRTWLGAFPGQLHAVGAAFRVGAPAPEDGALLAGHWSAMRKPLDAGPLSRNYLLPGAVLLGRLERAGDRSGAARLRAELKRMAGATGAMDDLRKLGIVKP